MKRRRRWIRSEDFELALPFSARVPEPLETDSARQATFDRWLHESWCEECERHVHIDLTHAALRAAELARHLFRDVKQTALHSVKADDGETSST